MNPSTLAWAIAAALVGLTAVLVFVAVPRLVRVTAERERRLATARGAHQLDTLRALSLAIDARQHPDRIGNRVDAYAVALAAAVGMDEAESQAVRAAALLRDVGKLTVPEYILAKTGPLTVEETEKVKAHPRAGADIVAAIPFPYPVAPLVLSHHERWDGRGYPRGLRGIDIPLGARIVSLADACDALLSAHAVDEGVGSFDAVTSALRSDAGAAFDPALVETLVRILPTLRRAGTPSLDAAPDVSPTSAHEPAPQATDALTSVLQDISVAHHEIDVLARLSQAMGSGLGLADTMSRMAVTLAELVPFTSCALFACSDASDALACVFATGDEADMLTRLRFQYGEGHTGWVALHRTTRLDGVAAEDIALGGWVSGTTLQSACISPLVIGGRLVGTLNIYHSSPVFYTREHRRLMERVCDQAAGVVANALVFDRTKEASLTDPLTGLANRRRVQTYMAHELARAERSRHEVSIVVLDLDHFKLINDTFGHQAGDAALREVAQALTRDVRPYDICARLAGDEFVVIMTSCGREEAERKRLELEAAVACVRFEPMPGMTTRLSVSAGTASYPADAWDYESMMGLADRRMYAQKSRTRGFLHFETPLAVSTPTVRRRATHVAHARPVGASQPVRAPRETAVRKSRRAVSS